MNLAAATLDTKLQKNAPSHAGKVGRSASSQLSHAGESANLDLLRATAVLCVVLGHLSASAGLPFPKNWSFFGVVLFFVHTSFVLMGSLARLEVTGFTRPWPLALGFMIRRIFRIYPLSILFVLLVPVFGIPHFPGEAYAWLGWPAFLSNLAITQNLTKSRVVLAPLWTLPVEVQMYCVLPFLYMALRRGRYRSFFFWLAAVLVAVTIPTIFIGRLNILLYAPCFVAGMVAFELSKVSAKRLPAWLWPLTLALVIAVWTPFGNANFMAEVRRAWVFALVLAVFVPQFREITMAAVAKPAHLIAKYSYGLYLSHVVIYWLAIDAMRHFPLALRILVGVAGIIVVPVAVFHLVEDPCIKMGGRCAARLKLVGG